MNRLEINCQERVVNMGIKKIIRKIVFPNSYDSKAYLNYLRRMGGGTDW